MRLKFVWYLTVGTLSWLWFAGIGYSTFHYLKPNPEVVQLQPEMLLSSLDSAYLAEVDLNPRAVSRERHIISSLLYKNKKESRIDERISMMEYNKDWYFALIDSAGQEDYRKWINNDPDQARDRKTPFQYFIRSVVSGYSDSIFLFTLYQTNRDKQGLRLQVIDKTAIPTLVNYNPQDKQVIIYDRGIPLSEDDFYTIYHSVYQSDFFRLPSQQMVRSGCCWGCSEYTLEYYSGQEGSFGQYHRANETGWLPYTGVGKTANELASLWIKSVKDHKMATSLKRVIRFDLPQK